MNARAWKVGGPFSQFARKWTLMAVVTAVVWLIAGFVPNPWRYGIWATCILFAFSGPLLPFFREFNVRFPIDLEHMSERYGLLTIIVLGESFVKVLSYINNEGYGANSESLPYLFRGAMVLTTTCCLWWNYFDDVAGATLRKQRGAFNVWFYSHLPLAIGITAVGVGLKKFISLDLLAVAPAEYRWLLAGALSITLFSVAVIDSVTERRNAELSDATRVLLRFFSAGLLLVLAQVGEFMSTGVFLAVVTGVCVAQVLFDIIMAPLEETDSDAQHLNAMEAAKRRLAGDAPATRTSDQASVIDGSFFSGADTDPMVSYGTVKYMAALWMSAMARKHPDIRFVTMSPGGTSGTAAVDAMSGFTGTMMKYVGMPMMKLFGMMHGVETGASRYIEAITEDRFQSGVFYASHDGKTTGPVVDQATIFPELAKAAVQDHAEQAIRRFI